jgi:tetratricopeptide (TPR) repeat protein
VSRLLIRFTCVAGILLYTGLTLSVASSQNCRAQSGPQAPRSSNSQQQIASSNDPLSPLLAQAQDALDRKDFAAALPLLEKIAVAKPNDALPHFELGFVYSSLKKNPEAIAEYRRAISLDSKLAPAHLNLGLELLDSDPASAAESFRRAAELMPGQSRPLYLLGQALEHSGKRSEAIQQYHAALAITPKDDAILFALSRALLADGQFASAEANFRQLLGLKPDSAPGQLGLAESLLSQQKTAAAADALAGYLQKVPNDAHARFELAVALENLNRFDDSLRELDQLEQRAAPTSDSLKLRGSIYLQQKKWSDAEASLEKAIAASPADPQLHLWLGQAKMESHDYAAAEKELLRCLELSPGNADAIRQLVPVYYLSGQYERTISTLDVLAKRETPDALDWFFRALSCDKLGQKAEAAGAYRKFLELDRGERPDQEFQAQARLKLLQRELSRSGK